MFRFYLDNTLVTDPTNWGDFTETIEYDQILNALLPKYDVKLSFNGDGYAYLFGQRTTYGYCKVVTIKIDYQCSDNAGYKTILNGTILISDCRFHENRCIVECDILDNNYGAKIFNNKSIKVKLDVARSKNDTAITACAYDNIQVFIPTTGVMSGASTRRAYKLHDAFRFLIDFMTDGSVGFESTFLSTLTDNYGIEGLRIITGQELRLFDGLNAPYICFQDLFHEIDIKYPLGFTIITVAGVPTIKIEDAAYFYNTTSSITVANIPNLVSSFNNELLYSQIKFGSTFLDYDGYQYNYPQIRFFNFADEEYHLQGQCNIDKVLDLTGFIISDSNVIEGCVATDVDNNTYDNEIFFIQISSISLLAITNVDPITLALPYFYNKNLQNNYIAERHNLQGDIALYLGSNNDTFRATNNVFQDLIGVTVTDVTNSANVLFSVLEFQDETTAPNYDTNGNYNNTAAPPAWAFVAPANGNYHLYAQLNVVEKAAELAVNPPGIAMNTGYLLWQVVFSIYDAGGAFLRDEFCPDYNIVAYPNDGLYPVYGGKNVFITTGGYAVCKLSVIGSAPMQKLLGLVVEVDSIFGCDQSVNGGGVYNSSIPEDYSVSRFEFDTPLSYTNYLLMKSDLSKSVIINHDGTTNRTTWIRKTVRKMKTGEMTWEQISTINNSH